MPSLWDEHSSPTPVDRIVPWLALATFGLAFSLPALQECSTTLYYIEHARTGFLEISEDPAGKVEAVAIRSTALDPPSALSK